MAAGRLLIDEVIMTDYGQFDLVWSGDGFGFDGYFDRCFAGQVNGLVGASNPHGVYLNLARRSGGSRVRIVLHAEGPPAPLHDWEDLVEVSSTLPDGASTCWVAWAGETSGAVDGLPGGSYRIRVSARGRDAAAQNEFADEVLDDYLLEIWPSGPADDAILRVGSENAMYWHRDVGGRG